MAAGGLCSESRPRGHDLLASSPSFQGDRGGVRSGRFAWRNCGRARRSASRDTRPGCPSPALPAPCLSSVRMSELLFVGGVYDGPALCHQRACLGAGPGGGLTPNPQYLSQSLTTSFLL
jgi:hypothetical protein